MMTEAQSGNDLLNSLSPGEWAVSAGALWILVVNYLVGYTIQEEYGTWLTQFTAPLSIAILLAVFVKNNGKTSAWNGLYPGTVFAAGIGIVFFTAADLLNGLVNDFSQSGEFYEITAYLAAAAVAFGIWSIQQQPS
jgi:hypothetical protein